MPVSIHDNRCLRLDQIGTPPPTHKRENAANHFLRFHRVSSLPIYQSITLIFEASSFKRLWQPHLDSSRGATFLIGWGTKSELVQPPARLIHHIVHQFFFARHLRRQVQGSGGTPPLIREGVSSQKTTSLPTK